MKQEVEPVHGGLNAYGMLVPFYRFASFPHIERTFGFVGIDLHRG